MRIKEETEIIEGEVVELEVDRPEAGSVAKTVRGASRQRLAETGRPMCACAICAAGCLAWCRR